MEKSNSIRLQRSTFNKVEAIIKNREERLDIKDSKTRIIAEAVNALAEKELKAEGI